MGANQYPLPTGSPPLVVLKACQTTGSMRLVMNDTCPSQKAAFTPVVCRLRAPKTYGPLLGAQGGFGGLGSHQE